MPPFDWVQVVMGLIGGGGLITAIVAWRRDARQGPIETSQANVADAMAISEAATNWVTYQDNKLRDQDAKIEMQDAKFEALEKKINTLQLKDRMWRGWYQDLALRWNHHRTKEEAPPPPTTYE